MKCVGCLPAENDLTPMKEIKDVNEKL
jgi:hypothetical protein